MPPDRDFFYRSKWDGRSGEQTGISPFSFLPESGAAASTVPNSRYWNAPRARPGATMRSLTAGRMNRDPNQSKCGFSGCPAGSKMV
jgi:hypothetical protein